MTARDPQEAVLLWLGAFWLLMALWCGLEWLLVRFPRSWRVRGWQRRTRGYLGAADRFKGALRNTVRPV